MEEGKQQTEKLYRRIEYVYVLFDLGSDVLRDVMLQRLQPDTLEQALQSRKSRIDELYGQNKISAHDYELLKEVPPDPVKFDIPLLMNILIHICQRVPDPLRRWLTRPDPIDILLGTDIELLAYIREDLLHKIKGRVTGDYLDETGATVEEALVRISRHGSKYLQNIQENIEAMKTALVGTRSVRNFLIFQVAAPLGQT